MERIELNLSGTMRVMHGVLCGMALFSFGVTLLISWLLKRRMTRSVDPEGVTLRSGKRHVFADLQGTRLVDLQRNARTVGYRVELEFSTGRAMIDTISYPEAIPAIRLIERTTRRAILPPAQPTA